MAKMFFMSYDDILCYPKDYFINIMKHDGITHIDVIEALPTKEKGIFWCSENSFCGDCSSESCGIINCRDYIPRNHKNGVCKFHSTKIYYHGNKITLKRKD